jgi:outer membrane immunogenic protein
MTKKGYLLATAAGAAAVAAAGGAQAADMAMPYKAPPLEPAAASWAGWYVGVNAGAAWQHANTTSPYGQAITDVSGFIGGGQLGYNWQDGNFVYGLEGDISGLTGTASKAGGLVSNKIDWLSTVRGRMGLAVGNTMAYVTGGLAIGGVNNSFGFGTYSDTSTKVGWAVGGGIEHMLWDRHWTVALEGLFVDLGRSSASAFGKTTHFSNQAMIGRFKLNYRF